MPDRDYEEPFSNPIAPPGANNVDHSFPSQRLTNDDFRKLLMTPRAPPPNVPPPVTSQRTDLRKSDNLEESKAEKRKKKKLYYAKLKRQEEDQLAELAKKYRDRAKERRDGANPDYQTDDPMMTAGGYRAVAPDAKSGLDAAERRRQMIQESKFLGGDMEHTHLVKGLDYALLQKVRSEINSKEKEEEEELEKIESETKKTEEEEETVEFKIKIAKNIHRLLFKTKLPEKNELFLPGRMAYVVDLEDEFAETDIPTTLIRSKQDIPNIETQTTLTTNDIVINKLTQILSYLRQGNRHNKKTKKKEKGKVKEEDRPKPTDESIYGEIGDYIPSLSKRDKEKERGASLRDKDTGHSYFEKPEEEEDDDDDDEVAREKAAGTVNFSSIKLDRDEILRVKEKIGEKNSRQQQLLTKLASEPQGYAECYPGFEEMQDAIEDSDDEVDYSKMDMGNKKGPIGRWDFDTQEEYSEYMNQKEALPKAAFQYGVKMADGRRTRRIPREKNEKAELDREWQKIKNIIDKRKAAGSSAGDEPEYKMPKY